MSEIRLDISTTARIRTEAPPRSPPPHEWPDPPTGRQLLALANPLRFLFSVGIQMTAPGTRGVVRSLTALSTSVAVVSLRKFARASGVWASIRSSGTPESLFALIRYVGCFSAEFERPHLQILANEL